MKIVKYAQKIKKLWSRGLRNFLIMLMTAVLLILGFSIFYHRVKDNFPTTPYGMMIWSKCDPEKTYFEMIMARERYYVPFAAFNQILVMDTKRYKEQIYLGYVYPDLGFEILDPQTPEERNRKIGVMVDDRSVVADNADMFSFFTKNPNIQKTNKIFHGYILYDDKNLQTLPVDHINTSIYYLDPEWKDGLSYISCSRHNNGCSLYVDKGRLSYLIDFRKEMFPEIKNIRDKIIQKVEGYKTKPADGFMLPEEYTSIGGGKFKCPD